MIRALIFDFNGVLADDDAVHMQVFREVAVEEGLSFTDEEYLEKYLPLNDRDCFTNLFQKHSLPLPPSRLDALIDRKGAYYFREIAEKNMLYSGTPQAIHAAAGRLPLAIASGARREEIIHNLRRGGLEGRFQVIISAEDVTCGKPDPEPFVRAYEQLCERNDSLKISDCVAVEDSLGGIQSAHAAGMRCLAIAHSYDSGRLRSVDAEWIIDSISNFEAWFDKEVPA